MLREDTLETCAAYKMFKNIGHSSPSMSLKHDFWKESQGVKFTQVIIT